MFVLFFKKCFYLSVFNHYQNITVLKRLLLSLALILPLCVQAQEHHEVGISAGVANYYGDLQTKIFPNYGYMPMAGIQYKFFMTPHVGLRFGANYATVTAADSLSDIPANKARNLSFASHIFEGHMGLEINFLPLDINRLKITPYVFGGIGVFYFNPYAMDPRGNTVFLRPLSTEGQGLPMYPDRTEYSNVTVCFPIGGGLKFLVGKTLVLTTELGFRYTNTDYLDDVSKTYVNLDTLMAYRGKLSVQMSYRGNQSPYWDGSTVHYGDLRGNSKANDWYWFGGVTASVYFRAFGNFKDYIQARCPKFFKHSR
jgi:hypothetical protein